MDIYEIAIRVVLAIFIGGFVGMNRQRVSRPAGFRTHILVCVGAAVVSLIQVEMIAMTRDLIEGNPVLANSMKADIGRMGAQVITGVGFLGAGTIIKEKGSVKGLTTAASVWVVACLGLAVGLGMYTLTGIAFTGVVISLMLFKRFEERYIVSPDEVFLDLDYWVKDRKKVHKFLDVIFSENSIKVECIEHNRDQQGIIHSSYTVQIPKYVEVEHIVSDLKEKRSIVDAYIVES